MILTMHGVVRERNRDLFVHRNRLDHNGFELYLKKRHQRFVSIELALRGEGDALTIDDGTHAAGVAAQLAVKHGHAATLFVNPYHTVSGDSYFFAWVDTALD